MTKLISAYLVEPGAGMELGYLAPNKGSKHQWKSATLILHQQTLNTLSGNTNYTLRSREKDPFGIDASQELERERSIQQGFDDLVSHTNTGRFHNLFPVIFLLPQTMKEEVLNGSKRLRVLNLLWTPKWAGTIPQAFGPDGCAEIIDVLQYNLHARGAINRQLRLENQLADNHYLAS